MCWHVQHNNNTAATVLQSCTDAAGIQVRWHANVIHPVDILLKGRALKEERQRWQSAPETPL